jgi:KDO2-lipid IV(A) lauroyltransferase
MKGLILRFAVFVLKHFFALLSPAAVARIGIVIGDIARVLDSRHRRIARQNLRMAFGDTKSEEEINEIIKGVFRNIGQTAVEFFQIPALTREKAHTIILPEYRKRLDKCLEQGKGALLLGAHFGNIELMAATAPRAGYKASAVARPLDDPDLEKIISEIRESSGLKLIPYRKSALMIVERLQANEIVGIAADQNMRKRNVFVDFFGIKAATTPGPAKLALKTGAPILPIYILREAPGKYKMIVEEPIEVESTGDEEADVIALTQKCANVIEDCVRRYPSQYLWVHRRWRTRPEGEAPIY